MTIVAQEEEIKYETINGKSVLKYKPRVELTKISPKYRDFGVDIDKIKTVPASKRRAVKRFKRVIHKSPSYKSQQRSLMEMRDDMAFGDDFL